jgi:hypothetical protein
MVISSYISSGLAGQVIKADGDTHFTVHQPKVVNETGVEQQGIANIFY